ncbi:SPOR domain-containing protein [Marinomonas mediterranea]|uniref:SPOR domain-containing protein n=1 Tax=Marinomonas mediterranea TaxID=119864 RepID=UPI00234A3C39|nr:AAA family ATPase [Marinomonas mediterranea]WCN10849.1 AAA family ATPase [Marinomonas mediterranea]
MAETSFQFDLEDALEQQQPKVMLRNPFSQEGGAFFASEERNQQLALLEHLSRYSNLLSIIEGESGSGKSRFLEEFIRAQGDVAEISRVKATMLMTAGQLLEAIYTGFASALPNVESRTSFGPLLKFAHELEGNGSKAIILIDNAQELNTDAIIMLMDMMSLATEAQEVPHVALFSEFPVSRNLDQYQTSRYEQLSHVLTLAPFSYEQTKAYLLHRVRAVGGGINLPFSDKQIKAIYQESGGQPGQINAVAQRLMGMGSAGKAKKKRKFSLSLGFPLVHMALLSLVMLGILMMVLFSDDTPESPQTASESIPPIAASPNAVRQSNSETIKRIEDMQRKLQEDAPVALPPIPADVLQPSANDQVAETQRAPSAQPSSVAVAPVRENTVGQSNNTPVVANIQPIASAPVVEKQAELEVVVERDPFDKTQFWKTQTPTRYTLQLLGTHNLNTVKDFIRDQGSIDEFSYFRAIHKGKAWFVVVYGSYRNRSEAIAAVEALPNDLRSLNPWARSIRGIQQDIVKAGS